MSLDGDADRFGNAVAVAGDVVAIGAFAEGAAYVYERHGDGWTLAARLSVADLGSEAHFGASVAVGSDTVAVGAWGGDEVFVYERSTSGWRLTARLRGSDTLPGDKFGSALALEHDLLAVGAVGRQEGRGAAYLFGRGPGGWDQQLRLDPPDAEAYGRFAASLALHGDLLAVGASTAASGPSASGGVHLFRLAAGRVEFEATLSPTFGDAAFRFGASLALGDDLLAVGSPGDDYGGYPSGPVYLFEHGARGWELGGRLPPEGLAPFTRFGVSVAVGADFVAVAAFTDNDQVDGSTSLYLFEGSESGWRAEPHVSLASSGLRFAAVASDARTLVVGMGGSDGETVLLYGIQ